MCDNYCVSSSVAPLFSWTSSQFSSFSTFMFPSSTSSIVFGSSFPFVSGRTHAASEAISARLPMKAKGSSLAVYISYSEICHNEQVRLQHLGVIYNAKG